MVGIDYLVTCVFVGFVFRGFGFVIVAYGGCVCWFAVACVGFGLGICCLFVG